MPTIRVVLSLLVASLISVALPETPVWAQAPKLKPEPAATTRFDIARFEVSGNTLLRQDEIDRAVAPFVGSQKQFSDIQGAIQSLERAYQARGFALVQVRVGEQDVMSGIVRLMVVQPRIGTVTVEGNRFFDEANIRSSLPGLMPGATPDSRQIARNLQLLAEHPAKQTSVVLKAGRENEVDAAVRVVDEKPLKFVFTLDNTGPESNTRHRAGIGLQHSNMFNRDHVFNLQYITSPDRPSDVSIFGAGYRIPFYTLGSSLDVFGGYSNVRSGTIQGLFSVSGGGKVFGTRYNIYLHKLGAYEHKLTFGLDYRAFEPKVEFEGNSLIPDITVRPASVAYSGLWRMARSEAGFYTSYSHNIPGGRKGSSDDFEASRTGASENYQILRGGLHYTHLFPQDWQTRAAINAQYTRDALVTGEQFGIGGPDSVRGFEVREFSDDKGYSLNLEVFTPDFGARLPWQNFRVRALAFYDMGQTRRNKIQPGESSGETGSSVGLGLRAAYSKSVVLRLDFANVLDAAASQSRNDRKLHASIAILL